jgi:hypothetical protein
MCIEVLLAHCLQSSGKWTRTQSLWSRNSNLIREKSVLHVSNGSTSKGHDRFGFICIYVISQFHKNVDRITFSRTEFALNYNLQKKYT